MSLGSETGELKPLEEKVQRNRESKSELIAVTTHCEQPSNAFPQEHHLLSSGFLDSALNPSEDRVPSVCDAPFKKVELDPPSGVRSPPLSIDTKRPSSLTHSFSVVPSSTADSEPPAGTSVVPPSIGSDLVSDTGIGSIVVAGSTLTEAMAAGRIQEPVTLSDSSSNDTPVKVTIKPKSQSLRVSSRSLLKEHFNSCEPFSLSPGLPTKAFTEEQISSALRGVAK